MADSSHPPEGAPLRWWAIALAALPPWVAYVTTASAFGYWLDAGEFTAQAAHLDIAHPPGHPLAGLVGVAATLLPFGPLPFRVALAQSVCVSGAAAVYFCALRATVRAIGVSSERIVLPLSLAGAWLVAFSYAWWFQAVRPEVYGLQALLVAVVIERAVACQTRESVGDARPFYVASFALGCALANHHFVAILVGLACLPSAVRVLRARGRPALLRSVAALAMGLSAYLYLPVRASTRPPLNLGDPSDLGRFWWVVSAEVYQQNKGSASPEPLMDRLFGAIEIAATAFFGPDALGWGFLVLVLALAGLYALLRTRSTRRLGTLWGLIVFCVVSGPAWLMSVRSNPDILGYMMIGLAAVVALAVSCLAAVFARVELPETGRRGWAAPAALAAGALLLAFSSARIGGERATLAGFRTTDHFDEARIRALPQNTIVVATRPWTVFRHWSVAAVEAARPDVTLIPLPFLRYPGVADALVARDPDVRPLVSAYLLEGELRASELQTLAVRRPVRVELDVSVPLPLYETLLPAGTLYAVNESRVTPAQLREAAPAHGEALGTLLRRLGPAALDDRRTREQLLWVHYVDALYFAWMGAPDVARSAVEHGLALNPQARELTRLGEALRGATGRVDVRPFVVGD